MDSPTPPSTLLTALTNVVNYVSGVLFTLNSLYCYLNNLVSLVAELIHVWTQDTQTRTHGRTFFLRRPTLLYRPQSASHRVRNSIEISVRKFGTNFATTLCTLHKATISVIA